MLFCVMSFVAVGADITPPAVKVVGAQDALFPADGKTNVYTGDTVSFYVEFDEAVQIATGTGIVGLYNSSNVQIATIPVNAASFSSAKLQFLDGTTSGTKLRIVFDYTLFEEEKSYSITVTGDAFQDLAGNRFAGLGAGKWDFTAGDYTPAILKALSPQGNVLAGSGISTPTLKLEFDDIMVAGAGSVHIYKVDAGPVTNGQGTYVASYAASTFTFSGVKNAAGNYEVTKSAIPGLDPLAYYYVRVDANAFKDNSANDQYFAGINNSTEWKFRMADLAGPTYSAALAENAGVGTAPAVLVKKDGKVVFTFTDTKEGFVLQSWNGTAVTPIAANADLTTKFTVAPAAAGFSAKYIGENKVEITPPTTGWASGTPYTININDGNYFADVEKNRTSIDATKAISFTTGDFIAPVIDAANTTVAVNASTNTKIDLKVKLLTETSLPVDVYYYVVEASATQPTAFDAATWTKHATKITALATQLSITAIDKDAANVTLKSATAYKVYVVAADAATTGVNFSAYNSTILNVTTSDIVKPTVSWVKFAPGPAVPTAATVLSEATTNVDKAAYVVVKFSEPVSLVGAATWADVVEIKQGSTTKTVATASSIDASTYYFQISDDEVNYASSIWKSNTAYSVKVLGTKVKDASTNAGTDGSVLNFTIKDYEGPNPVYSYINNATSTYTKKNSEHPVIDVATGVTVKIDLGEPTKTADGQWLDNSNIANHVIVRDAANLLVYGTFTISNSQVITFKPNNSLVKDNKQYSIELTSTLKDANDNKLGYFEASTIKLPNFNGEIVLFRTADETAPLITLTPANGQTNLNDNVPMSVSINDDIYVKVGDNYVQLNASDANFIRQFVTLKKADGTNIQFDLATVTVGNPTTYSIIPFNTLDANTTYVLSVSNVFDAAVPTRNSANATSTFSIREYEKPFVVVNGYDPYDGKKFVLAADPLKMLFNEPVVGVAGKNITITGVDILSATTTATVDAGTVTISGNTVTIPHAAFTELTNYTITIDAGAFKDAVGNDFAGLTDTTVWNFSSFDATAPVLLSTVPADAAATPSAGPAIARPSVLTINFTEASGKILPGSGKIYIRDLDVAGIAQLEISSLSSNVTYTGNKVDITVDPSIFNYGKQYWIEIEPTAFKDEAGNFYAGNMGNQATWNFVIEADQAPYITALSPAQNVDQVSTSLETFEITFSEPVRLNATPKTLNIFDLTLGVPSQATVIYTANLSSSNTSLTEGGLKATITVPVGTLLANKDYEIRFLATAFEDVDGTVNNPLYELDGTANVGLALHNWKFSTKDNTAPVVTATLPGSTTALTATDVVANGTDIVIRFNETVRLVSGATLANGFNIGLGVGTGFTAAWDGNTVVLNPTADFGSDAVVTVTVVSGVIEDLSGNAATGSITFKAADSLKPTWSSNPVLAAGTTATSAVATMTMSEPGKVYYMIQPSTATVPTTTDALILGKSGEFDVTAASINKTITGLESTKSYKISFVGVDVTGNKMVDGNIRTITVTTLDNLAPVLDLAAAGYTNGLKPANGSACVATSGSIELMFDENVTVDPSKFWIREVATYYSAPAPATVTVSSAGKVVTIAYAGLKEKTEYFLEINPNAVWDGSTNYWNTVYYGKTTYTFTTADETAPSFVAFDAAKKEPFNPIDGDKLESNTIKFTLDEPVAKGTGNIYIYRTLDAAPAVAHEIINVTNSDVVLTNGEKTVEITLHNQLSENVDYYVEIPSGVIVDKGCKANPLAGINSTSIVGTTPHASHPVYGNQTIDTYKLEWNIQGKDNTAPYVYKVNQEAVTTIPTQGASSDIVLEFSEVVYKAGAGLNPIDAAWVKSKLSADNSLNLNLATVTVAVSDITVAIPYPRTVTQVTISGIVYKSLTNYTFTFAAGSVKDAAGNLNPVKTWSVSTRDDDAPVATWDPTNKNSTGATIIVQNLDLKPTIKLNFDEPVILDNNVYITNANVSNLLKVENVSGIGTPAVVTAVPFTATIADNKVITIVPNADLLSHYTYRITFLAAANNIKELDEYGVVGANKLTTDFSYEFKVKDARNPELDAFVPATASPLTVISGATMSAPLEIKIKTYNPTTTGGAYAINVVEKMVASAAGKVEIRRSNGTVYNVVNASDCDFTTAGKILIPHSKGLDRTSLEENTTYYVNYAAGTFTDEAGNPLAGVTGTGTWRFSTADVTKPLVDKFEPITPELPAIYSDLKIYFKGNVSKGAGYVHVYNKTTNANDDGNWIESIDVTSSRVILEGTSIANGLTNNVAVIDPVNDLDPLGSYYIRVDQGTFTNGAGSYAGVYDYDTWTFGVTNNARPVPVSAYPVLAGTDVIPQDTTFTLNFDRTIALGTGDIKIYEYRTNPVAPYDIDSRLVDVIPVTDATISEDAKSLSFNSNIVLRDGIAHYYILIDNGAITNDAVSRDAWAGFGDPFNWKFSTVADNVTPELAGLLLDAVAPINQTCLDKGVLNLTMNFTEPVMAGDGNIVIKKVEGNVIAETIAANDATKVSFANGDSTIIISPTDLEDLTEYYVVVENTAIKDTSTTSTHYVSASSVPNFFAGSSIAAGDWKFETGDVEAPVLDLTKSTPNGDNVVDVDQIVLTFDEVVIPVAEGVTAGKVIVTEVGATEEYFSAVITEEMIANNVVTIPVGKAFDNTTEFVVTVEANAVTDTPGACDSILGVRGNVEYTWNFSTDAAPFVTADPMSSAAALDTFEVVLSFSEPVATVDASTVKVAGGSIVNDTIVDNLDNTYAMMLTGKDGDTIVVTFDESIVDARGNKLLPASFTYTVGDNVAPKLVTALPNAELGSFDNLALEMTFDDVVEGVEGKKVYVYKGGAVDPVASIDAKAFVTEDGLYFTAPFTLAGNGNYYVMVDAGAFVDNTATSKGKNYAGIADSTTWKFAVVDNVFCTDNIEFTPVDGTSNMPVTGVELTVKFCEPVVLTEKFVAYIAESSDNTTRFSVTTGTLSADGLTLTMKITETLGSATTYAVTMPNGAVTDKAGTPWIGIVDANQWNFTTGDVVAPTVTATPGTGENLPNTFKVSLKFSENVTIPTNAITVSAGTVSVTGSGSDYEVTVTNATDNATVTLSLGNTIVDAAGNKLPATTFTYKVGDNTAPATTALTPTGNTENANVVLTMTFNEDVVKGTGKLQIFDGSVVAKEFNVTDAAVVVNGKTVSITMPESLKKFTNYFVMVDARFVKDAAGNNFAGISSPLTWKFTTGDYKTSVDDLAKSIKVYPTVFENFIRVEASTDVVLTKAVITNIAGQMVKEVVDFDNTIPTSDLRSGVYFISLHTADGIAKTERIIKR